MDVDERELDNSKITNLKKQLEDRMNIDENQEEEILQESDDEDKEVDEHNIRVHFRNYVPRDNHLKNYIRKHQASLTHVEEQEDDTLKTKKTFLDQSNEDEDFSKKKKQHLVQKFFQSPEEATDEILKEIIGPILQEARKGTDTDATLNLLPQKVNFDLKRDIFKQLDLLEKRTLKALSEMLQEKIDLENEESSEED
ncbi:hypothetical protein AKO1_008283 [Acrasis kona]|uniref:Uncharacterized protein n=1 Tax=Acrasis kona TaxID=1008807 RepID=A0AAW2YNK3_9EUKA